MNILGQEDVNQTIYFPRSLIYLVIDEILQATASSIMDKN
jgi:uncharacterized UBP type Zn finger protein